MSLVISIKCFNFNIITNLKIGAYVWVNMKYKTSMSYEFNVVSLRLNKGAY